MIEMKERSRAEKAAYLDGYCAALHIAAAALVRIAAASDAGVAEMQTQIAVLLALGAAEKDDP